MDLIRELHGAGRRALSRLGDGFRFPESLLPVPDFPVSERREFAAQDPPEELPPRSEQRRKFGFGDFPVFSLQIRDSAAETSSLQTAPTAIRSSMSRTAPE